MVITLVLLWVAPSGTGSSPRNHGSIKRQYFPLVLEIFSNYFPYEFCEFSGKKRRTCAITQTLPGVLRHLSHIFASEAQLPSKTQDSLESRRFHSSRQPEWNCARERDMGKSLKMLDFVQRTATEMENSCSYNHYSYCCQRASKMNL